MHLRSGASTAVHRISASRALLPAAQHAGPRSWRPTRPRRQPVRSQSPREQASASMAARDPQDAAGLTVTVCGGGNAAHVAAGMFSHRGATINLLTVPAEVDRWQLNKDKAIEVYKKQERESYTGHVSNVTADAGAVVPPADIILLIVPAYAHRPILESIAPHLQPGATILAMPAPGNFDLLARQVLGPKADEVTVAGTVCLPWACRIMEYARKVELLGEKCPVDLVARPAAAVVKVKGMADRLHDRTQFRTRALFLQATLFPTNPVLHPGVMYGTWSRWDGEPLAERPLFYEAVDDFTASVLEGEDAEIQATRRALEAALGLQLPIPTLQEQMVEGYGSQIADPSTYKSMLRTNSALMGLFHPTLQTEDGRWLPDYSSRYLHEDVTVGLAAMKGLAQLMGVDTPTMDKVMGWAQGVMGKEYLLGDKLAGRDVPKSGAPQAFGIAAKEALLSELRHQLGSAMAEQD